MFDFVKSRFLVPGFSFVVDSECAFVHVNPFEVFLSRRMYRLSKKRKKPSALEVDESVFRIEILIANMAPVKDLMFFGIASKQISSSAVRSRDSCKLFPLTSIQVC